jgi:hypothetical protein
MKNSNTPSLDVRYITPGFPELRDSVGVLVVDELAGDLGRKIACSTARISERKDPDIILAVCVGCRRCGSLDRGWCVILLDHKPSELAKYYAQGVSQLWGARTRGCVSCDSSCSVKLKTLSKGGDSAMNHCK